MFLNENYVILDDDDEVEMLEEDILMEGEVLFDEDIKTKATRRFKVIEGPNDIDYEESKENINKMVSKFESLKNKNSSTAKHQYRDYKSTDKTLLAEKLRNKEFIKNLFGSLVGVTYSAVKYKVFNYKGLTLVAFSVPRTTVKEVGTGMRVANPCYAILIRDEATIVLKKIKIYGKKIDVEDRIS